LHENALRRARPPKSNTRRVLLVTPQPFYEDRGSPIAVRHLLHALGELGCEVDVVSFPFGKELELPGVRYFRVANPFRFSGVPIGFSFRKLFLDLLLVAKIRERLKRDDYLAVHALEEAAFPAAVIGRRYGVFVVYDMQSSLPEQLGQSFSLLRTRAARRLLDKTERWLLRRANFIGCSAGLAAHARAVAPDTPIVEWLFPSGISDYPPVDPEGIRRALELPDDARIVLYAGSFAAYQGLDLLLDAIERVSQAEPRAHFVLVGAESRRELEGMRAALDPARAARVRLLPRVPREQIPGFLALADVVVSTRRSSRNVPLKIFDYLEAGVTIVATDDAAHRAILDEETAVLAEPSPYAFAKALIAILRDRERADRLAAGALAYARARMTRANFVESIARIIECATRFQRESDPRESARGGPRAAGGADVPTA